MGIEEFYESKLKEAEAEIDRLRGALRKIANGTEDAEPPYRAINASIMGQIARNALLPR